MLTAREKGYQTPSINASRIYKPDRYAATETRSGPTAEDASTASRPRSLNDGP